MSPTALDDDDVVVVSLLLPGPRLPLIREPRLCVGCSRVEMVVTRYKKRILGADGYMARNTSFYRYNKFYITSNNGFHLGFVTSVDRRL